MKIELLNINEHELNFATHGQGYLTIHKKFRMYIFHYCVADTPQVYSAKKLNCIQILPE